MSRQVRKAEQFIEDFDRQFRWYDRKAGWDVARHYLAAIDRTLEKARPATGLGSCAAVPTAGIAGRSFSGGGAPLPSAPGLLPV